MRQHATWVAGVSLRSRRRGSARETSSSLHERARRRSGGVVLALLLAGCARREAAPAWIHLARGFTPASGADLGRAWSASRTPIDVRAEDGGRALWLGAALPAGAWYASDAPGRSFREWRAARPIARAFRNRGEEELALELGGARLRGVFGRTGAEKRAGTGETVLLAEGERLVLLRPGAEPPGPGRFSCRVERGVEADGTWRAVVQELVADGLSIWPGERWETSLELPPGSALRFTTLARGLGHPGRARFRVTCDGELLLDHEEALADAGQGTWHVLPLRAAGAARLTFEVAGDPGLTAFLHPSIGPHEVGTSAARPWRASCPDVVLFLADTFRADLLESDVVAPNLHRRAGRSLRFQRARSPSTWTLPAQSSLFTGLFPTQHGALRHGQTFSPALVTLAERLAQAGYRTGAVTDAGFVSRQYGLDQGFEWFLEHPDSAEQRLAKTLDAARAFLARDDGRPAFLFVHTYRTHWPYRTGPEEDRRAHDALVARFSSALAPGTRPDPALLATFADELAALYRQAASALDWLAGSWFDELERSGFFRRGFLAFTSDHGEAFFEHGKSEHGGPPFEEELRIPLFLFGPGLEPRASNAAASLLDLAPTLAELCGIRVDPSWCGRSLLAPEVERPALAWHGEADASLFAIVAGERKVFVPARLEALERGEVKSAFDLARDPGERDNVLRRGEAWPAELAHSAAAGFAPLVRLQAESAEVEVGAWLEEELAKLGYGGE